ncbi:GNAT family N-acetyltransferase [Streptomyces sp. NPDC051940]|uniref:GNAT family N-acetyltransferase n=1 Tax=Streptomyces sp. NPDC051940 TaxID=3155675 RepID=UPI00342FCC9F
MRLVIDTARRQDAPALAHALLAAWLETYPRPSAGIDEAWIREHRGDAVDDDGIAQWERFVEDTGRRPAHSFCRVVRRGDAIVGFLCGRRDEETTLGPMYLLRQAQGQGIGHQLMAAFLDWAGDAPVRLWVTAYNERAVGFYRRYGFEDTGERHLWRDRLPNIRMCRPGGPS